MESVDKVNKNMQREFKFIVKSIIPTTMNFVMNDSSMDEILEFRSLTSDSFKINQKIQGRTQENDNNLSYTEDIKKFKENVKARKNDDSGCKSEQYSSEGSHGDSAIVKNVETDRIYKLPSSSTPIKFGKDQKVELDISGVGFLNFNEGDDHQELKHSLNDSDFESMEHDFESVLNEKVAENDKTLLSKDDIQNLPIPINSSQNTSIKISESLCMQKISSEKSESQKSMENSQMSNGSSFSDLKINVKSMLDETIRRTPKAIRRAFQKPILESESSSSASPSKKTSKFMNIFSTTKKKKRNSLKKRKRKSVISRKSHLLKLRQLEKENKEGDENFEYSFTCEPSMSDKDLDGSTNYISYNTSLDLSIGLMKSPLLPTFRIDEAPVCGYVKHLIKCSLASNVSLKRSLSDSWNFGNQQHNLVTETDSESLMEMPIKPSTFQSLQASIKSLTKLSTKHISSDASPFKRWGGSSLRSRVSDIRNPLHRRPSSLAASESDVYSKANLNNNNDEDFCPKKMETKQQPSGPTLWGQSFEILLNDSAGLHAFAQFLKKEFSAENIYFWTSCERYRQMNDINQRTKEALEIYNKHLANGALEPVNVDGMARNTVKDGLEIADKELFTVPQKQIFNLMKFDSYQRFIRSDLYKNCLEAEQKSLPLPFTAESLDPMLRINLQTSQTASTITKLKKSLSNAEDRRRKSLLPWNRKVRCKSKDREENKEKDCPTKNSTSSSNSNTLKIMSNQSASDLHSSRSSLSSFDATISKIGSFDPEDSKCSLCRVFLDNGATTIVQTREHEKIRELLGRLLEKRGIFYQSFEACLVGEKSKPLDLDSPSSVLAGKEIIIEQRIQFKLDLPNKKVISVKSKPAKILSEVLRPILYKYNYRLDMCQVSKMKEEVPELVDIGIPVPAIDGQRLQIFCKSNGEADWQGEVTPITAGTSNPITFVRANKAIGQPTASTLDEITNKVFNELMQGKNCSGIQNIKRDGSVKSDGWGSDTSSIFGRLRYRDSNSNRGDGKLKKNLSKNSVVCSEDGNESSNGMKKPLIAKWKTGVKLQQHANDELLEGLKKAQRFRLEDQRGTEINFELPDFLKDKEKHNSNANKLRKTKFDESPSNSVSLYNSSSDQISLSPQRPPQPAPRLSIVGRKSPSKIENLSSVQAKINNLENSILMNCPSGARSPIDSLNLSTQCIASNTPIKSRNSESSICNQPIYYCPDNTGIYADTTMVFNHQQLNESHNYQEIDIKCNNEAGDLPPKLPPKPVLAPIKPSNWQGKFAHNKENLFKVPQELPRRVLDTNPQDLNSDAYLDQPYRSSVV